jgi:hypothetical protein
MLVGEYPAFTSEGNQALGSRWHPSSVVSPGNRKESLGRQECRLLTALVVYASFDPISIVLLSFIWLLLSSGFEIL